MKRLRPEPAYTVGARLAEGPVWDADTGQLLFVDIFAGRLHRTRTDGGLDTLLQLDEELGAALPAIDGTFLLATRSGFSIMGTDGSVRPLLHHPADDVRFNDAKCDPLGRCFAGTAATGQPPVPCALYRLDDGPAAQVVVAGVGLSNGLGWSPDGRFLYYADTPAGRVDRFPYDLDTGNLGARDDFIRERPGTPDGLCVDSEGGIWLALWEGSEVHRYSPDGQLDTVLELPVPHISSCAFGGPAGQTLFITTARPAELSAVDLAGAPHAGDIFAVEPGVAAPPATLWQPVMVS